VDELLEAVFSERSVPGLYNKYTRRTDTNDRLPKYRPDLSSDDCAEEDQQLQ
jgi:hypothetical protein